MAESDFERVTNSIDPTAGSIAVGVSGGLPKASTATGSFVYVATARTGDALGSAYALRFVQADFDPCASGGEASALVCRFRAGAQPFVFFGLQDDDANASAYLLGLSDGGRIELRKGSMQRGLPDEVPTGPSNVIARGVDIFEPGAWVHLRLEVVCNASGDSVLNPAMSVAPASAPVWKDIPGIPSSICDDVAGIAHGLPLAGGRLGFGVAFSTVGGVGLFDQFAARRQF